MKASFTHMNPKANKGIKNPKLGKNSKRQFGHNSPNKPKELPPKQQSLAEFFKKK